jgi:hypothetical protein
MCEVLHGILEVIFPETFTINLINWFSIFNFIFAWDIIIAHILFATWIFRICLMINPGCWGQTSHQTSNILLWWEYSQSSLPSILKMKYIIVDNKIYSSNLAVTPNLLINHSSFLLFFSFPASSILLHFCEVYF